MDSPVLTAGADWEDWVARSPEFADQADMAADSMASAAHPVVMVADPPDSAVDMAADSEVDLVARSLAVWVVWGPG